MVIRYNSQFLEQTDFVTEAEISRVMDLNKKYGIESLLTKHSRTFEALAIDFIHASAQIEGNTYSKLDTAELILNGQTAGGKLYSEARMILNMRRAFDKIINGAYIIDRNFLCDLHFQICSDELPNSNLGTVRTESVLITGSDYVPLTNANSLNEELKYMFLKSAAIENHIAKAIYLHLNTAYLQYFQDGNKRSARMLQTATMLKGGLVPLLFSEIAVKGYRSAIINYYETGNSRAYVDWFVTQYDFMYEKLLPFEDNIKTRD